MEYIQRIQTPPLSVFVHPGLEIKDGHKGERGIFVKHEVPRGEVLVRVPSRSLFTLDTLKDDNAALRTVLSAKLREDDALSIALLYERFGRPSESPSRWASHMEVLPTGRLLNAINLSPTALQRLEGSSLYAVTSQQKQQVISDFEELSALPLMVGDTLLSEHEWWSIENYRWALTQIHSRFISISTQPGAPSRKAMAPLFDLFNHSCATPPALNHCFVAASADEEVESSLVVVAGRSLVEGEEACLNYGPHGNLKLLQLYGFVVPDNPFDSLDIWALMDRAAPDYEVKDRVMTRLGLHPPFALTKKTPFLSPSLLACIRIQRAQGNELACLENALEGPLSAANERETLRALEKALKAMQDALHIKAEEDIEGGEGEEQEESGEEDKEERRLVRLYLQSEHALLSRGLEAVATLQGQHV